MKAGWDAFLGMTGLLLNSFSVLSKTSLGVSSMAFLLCDLADVFFKSILPLLLVAPLDECSCTLTSDIVGKVGTVGTGVIGVPFKILVSINVINAEHRALVNLTLYKILLRFVRSILFSSLMKFYDFFSIKYLNI